MSARTYLALFVFYAIVAFVFWSPVGALMSGVGIGLMISRLGEEAEMKAE